MARIKVVEYKDAEGRLLEIYDHLILSRGKLAEVHKIQSLRPESILKHMDLYMELMYTKSELSRAERELIAVVVSVSNRCRYCQIHHIEALNHYWKNEDRVALLMVDFQLLDLSNRENALCYISKELTLNPESFEDQDLIQHLKSNGISDAGILDAVMIIAYFNFVNRIVLSLGVDIELDSGGYKY